MFETGSVGLVETQLFFTPEFESLIFDNNIVNFVKKKQQQKNKKKTKKKKTKKKPEQAELAENLLQATYHSDLCASCIHFHY